MNSKTRRPRQQPSDDTTVEVSSGNIFRDLRRPDAAEAMAKVELAHRIHRLITASGLTQAQTAKRLGIDQPKVSNLLRGRLRDFSIERLFRFLNLLGQDVDVTIRSARRTEGKMRVCA